MQFMVIMFTLLIRPVAELIKVDMALQSDKLSLSQFNLPDYKCNKHGYDSNKRILCFEYDA